MRNLISEFAEEDSRTNPDDSGTKPRRFKYTDEIQDLLPLNLTPVSHMSIITVVGNTDVDIYLQKRNLLSMTPVIA